MSFSVIVSVVKLSCTADFYVLSMEPLVCFPQTAQSALLMCLLYCELVITGIVYFAQKQWLWMMTLKSVSVLIWKARVKVLAFWQRLYDDLLPWLLWLWTVIFTMIVDRMSELWMCCRVSSAKCYNCRAPTALCQPVRGVPKTYQRPVTKPRHIITYIQQTAHCYRTSRRDVHARAVRGTLNNDISQS